MIPKYIAICGNPKSGKSLVQTILERDYQVIPVDDGWPLRHFAISHLGLTTDQVTTQDGKASFVEINGRRWQVRDILGQLGNQLETMFGANIMPWMAINRSYESDRSYSFGSVRRDQGLVYKKHGGIVLGIRNPLAPPSPYKFDRFDETIVDHWIDNDALARGLKGKRAEEDLEAKIWHVMRKAQTDAR